jgi:hypothetical protein
MKLSTVQVKDVLNQMETQVIPSSHPAMQQLERTFGAHTFFLGGEGLHVVERGEMEGGATEAAYAVKVASWSDDSKTRLVPHPGTVAKAVDIGPESADLGNPDADEAYESMAASETQPKS